MSRAYNATEEKYSSLLAWILFVENVRKKNGVWNKYVQALAAIRRCMCSSINTWFDGRGINVLGIYL